MTSLASRRSAASDPVDTMATKAERYRAEMQRAAQAKAPKKTAASGRSAGRAKDRIPNQASHNEAPVRGRNSSYELEISATPRPSRKQTRKSHDRQKTDSQLRIAEMNRNARPQARAMRRSGNPN